VAATPSRKILTILSQQPTESLDTSDLVLSSLDLDSNSEHFVGHCAIHTLVNDDKVKSGVTGRDFKWEFILNCRGQEVLSIGEFGLQSAAKDTIF
jgi:hypothetical protein